MAGIKSSAAWPWNPISMVAGVLAVLLLWTAGVSVVWFLLTITSFYAYGRSAQMSALGIKRVEYSRSPQW